jgi:N-acetylneuraminic acid mutarotase
MAAFVGVIGLAVPVGLIVPIGTTAAPAWAGLPARGQSGANTFAPIRSMSVRRTGATATLLGDGDVLVAGGGTASAELYHPGTRSWTTAPSMSTARTDATATLLQNGDVLVAGGCCEAGHPSAGLTSAEIYDPASDIWSPTGSLNVGRAGATATLLQNGDVLVAGGACNGQGYGCDTGSFLVNLKSAELYDPSTGVWTLTGSMSAGREFQTATLLENGEVLVTGGFNSCDDDFCTDLRGAQLFDPVTGTWLPTAPMNVPREQQTATLLTNGDVLVAGGLNQGGGSGFASTYASAEIYNPIFSRWTAVAPMNQPRYGQTATLLQGGWVLVTGGGSATSEVYEPGLDVWVPTGSLSTPRTDQTATLLSDGDVLVAGGTGPDQEPLSTAEVFRAGAGPLVDLSVKSLSFPTQEVDTTGNALAFTVTNYGTAPLDVSGVQTSGEDPSDFLATSACSRPIVVGASCSGEIRFSPLYPGLRTATVAVADDAPLDPQGVRVSGDSAGPYVWVPGASMLNPRRSFSATTLTNGAILVAGGENIFENTVSTTELYEPTTGSFTATGSLSTSRQFQAAVRLPDGSVLVAGGLTADQYSESVLSSAEIYDPRAGSWSPTASMLAAGEGLTADLLDNGLVLVTGFSSSDPELYDPVTSSWSNTAPSPFTGGQAVLLHDGMVLLTGGPDGASALYDPATNTWSSTGSMIIPQYAATATVLTDGDVLVVGGFGNGGSGPLTTAQVYNPAKGAWSMTDSLPSGRQGQSAVLLPNGSVLVAGGCSSYCQSSSATDATYVYSDGYWSETGALPTSRYGQQATVLPNGDVLLMGGTEGEDANATTSTDIYISPLISATPARAAAGQTITLVANGFYAHEVVVVMLGQKTLAKPEANDLGLFRLRVPIPALHTGTYTLSAQGQTSYVYAESNFVITKSA